MNISVPTRGSQDTGPAHIVPDNIGEDQGEVWEGIWGKWKSSWGLQQSWCWSQPVQSWRGEAQDELQHQAAADGRQQERVRQPAAENKWASGGKIIRIILIDPDRVNLLEIFIIVTICHLHHYIDQWSHTNWWHDPISLWSQAQCHIIYCYHHPLVIFPLIARFLSSNQDYSE